MRLNSRNNNNLRRPIPTLVKDQDLVLEKRRQIIDAAVNLFCEKGFHQTTTREIARDAGISVGALYEYVKSKEDVLYLVCDAIHSEMESRLAEGIREGANARDSLAQAVDSYIRACDRMQDSILLIYQETSSLDPESRSYVLANDERITSMFADILRQGRNDGSLRVPDDKALQLMAHNITVLGHMWAFRRWFLHKHYELDEFIKLQTSLILSELSNEHNNH